MTHEPPESDTLIALEATLFICEHVHPRAAWPGFIQREVIAQGGCWMAPTGDRASHLFEISLHGVTGRGTTVAEAVSDWHGAATCAVKHALERSA